MAKPNETIHLQSTTYKFHSLFIGNPVTLIGQPETILEVDGGSIYIDFRKNLERQQSVLTDNNNTSPRLETDNDPVVLVTPNQPGRGD